MKNQAFEFKSNFPLPESIRRLGERVRENGFSTERGRPAVGRVTAEQVRFFWYPGLDFVSSLKPVFTGRFFESSGQVFLCGHFEYSSGGKRKKFFSIVGPVIIAFSCLGALLDVASEKTTGFLDAAISITTCVLLLGGTILFRFWMRKTWSSETKALIGLIEEALR